jgi:hypothetical protein
MKENKKSVSEPEIEYLKSKPLTPGEKKELADFIKKSKQRKKIRTGRKKS